MRWFDDLIRMPPECLLGEVCSSGADPSQWEGNDSVTLPHLPDELEERGWGEWKSGLFCLEYCLWDLDLDKW